MASALKMTQKTQIIAATEVITPTMAESMLAKSESTGFRNRTLNMRHVESLANLIKDGHWRLNGQTVSLSHDGAIVDGQHRLKAIALAGVPVPVLVVYGVDSSTFGTIDKGRVRTNSDTLAVAGYVNTNRLAAASAVLYYYAKTGTITRSVNASRGEGVGPVIQDFVELHPGLEYSVSESSRLMKVEGMKPPSFIAAIHYIFGLVNPEKRDRFFHDVEHNQCTTGSGAAALVKSLRSTAVLEKMRLYMDYRAAIWIKGWNAEIEGRNIHTLVFNSQERFPKISRGLELPPLEHKTIRIPG